MLQVSQCKVSYKKNTVEHLKKKVASLLHISQDEMKDFHIVKKSLDARKKPEIYYTYTVQFSHADEEKVLKKNKKNRDLAVAPKKRDIFEGMDCSPKKERIVVIGCGPAGLFCAYYLSKCGYKPILIERGAKIEERTKDIEQFWQTAALNPESNVSFGEGGAGTFSDGKLNTGVKDKTGRKQFVLDSFVSFGAREDILYDAKPHIGTDILQTVIQNMRKEMEQCGCEFQFHSKMTDILTDGKKLTSVEIEYAGEKRIIACDKLVLAIGHSARDTFALLRDKKIEMSRKPFAVGVRVQHRQSDIDMAQYGVESDLLPVADYKCTGKTRDDRGVYSFCMCPGGYVVNASSEKGHLVVNGMSDADRDSGNANSAIVVTVEPEDFDGEDVLAGAQFQRKLESAAFSLCDGKIPVQRLEDFMENKVSSRCGKVNPCVKGQWDYGNLQNILPKFVSDGMIDGIRHFSKRLQGFADNDTLLLGVETRTSSPVRIERTADFESSTISGVYPCGEGAGYAGGIMSAAMDGLRVAMKINENIH